MTDLTTMRAAKRLVEADFLKRPGITGIDIESKIVAGKRTGKTDIRCREEEASRRHVFVKSQTVAAIREPA